MAGVGWAGSYLSDCKLTSLEPNRESEAHAGHAGLHIFLHVHCQAEHCLTHCPLISLPLQEWSTADLEKVISSLGKAFSKEKNSPWGPCLFSKFDVLPMKVNSLPPFMKCSLKASLERWIISHLYCTWRAFSVSRHQVHPLVTRMKTMT